MDQAWNAISGQHDAGWLGWIDYWTRFTDIQLAATEGVRSVGRSAGWWWAFEDAAIITDRPDRLERDNLNRLHSADGMAIRYRDGWGVHCWHGVRVPKWVITADRHAVDIISEPNQEIRRAAIEAAGWDRVLGELNVTPVDTCPDPGNSGNELRLVEVPRSITGRDPLLLLLASNGSVERDGTRREYALDVTGSGARGAVEAAAWTYDLEPGEYAQMVVRS